MINLPAPPGDFGRTQGDSAQPPPTWVLLRGLTREAGHWGEFPDQLQRAWPGAQVLAVDLPGNGRLWREPSPLRIAGYVAPVRAQLRAAALRPPVAVLALSLGAMVAAEWARQHPGELAGMVLVNTSLRPFSPVHHRLRPAQYPTLLRLASGLPDAVSAERLVLQMTARSADAAARVLPHWVALREQHPVSAPNALRQLWAAARYRAPQEPPGVPLLLLAGARDALVDPRCSRRLAEQWQVPLQQHPQAGHDLPLDDGAWVARQVRDWWPRRSHPHPR